MLQHIKLLQSPAQLLPTQNLYNVAQNQNLPTSISPLITKQYCKFSRREVALFTNSSLLLLFTSQTLDTPFSRARAEEISQENKGENDQQKEETIQERKAEAEQQKDEIPQDNVLENQQGVDIPQETTELQETIADNDRQIESEATRNNDQQIDKNPQDTKAENDQQRAETPHKSNSICNDRTPSKRAFLDISIDGKPAGRITIGLYGENVPVGATRFGDLVSGRAGISYRRKKFTKIMPNYVQHGGIRSYGVDAELASKTGRSLTNGKLMEEWARLNECAGTKNLAGTVSIIVRDPSKPPPTLKLVARKGKLEIDQEEVGVEPNGTEFTISTRDSPELDLSALVVGRVIEGMDVVEKIGLVKTVQESRSSPYFRVAKLIGDKRAVVAERGFNRPYSKVTVTNCGLLK